MPLKLKPRDLARRRYVRPFTVLRCVMAGHQVTHCRRLCTPFNGHGICGRMAPHDLPDRTQDDIPRRQATRTQLGLGAIHIAEIVNHGK